jgi:hypothetical protein
MLSPFKSINRMKIPHRHTSFIMIGNKGRLPASRENAKKMQKQYLFLNKIQNIHITKY